MYFNLSLQWAGVNFDAFFVIHPEIPRDSKIESGPEFEVFLYQIFKTYGLKAKWNEKILPFGSQHSN